MIFARFTPAQRLALDLERNVAVTAGAGSGKTQVLAGRYVWAMQQGGARPDEILAITFTEKAAAEMRARIRKWAGQADLSRARISTIHAFAASLLREHALLADVDPAFAILEGAERIVLLRETIDAVLDQLAADGAHGREAEALRVAARLHTRPQLVWQLRRLIERREQAQRWADATADATDEQLLARWRDAAPGGVALARRLLAEHASILVGMKVARRSAGKKAADAIDCALAAADAIAAGREDAVDELCTALFTKGGDPRSFASDPAGPAVVALARALGPHRDALLARIGPLDEAAAPQLRALALLSRAALLAWHARKSERQVLDFDDLGERAARLLGKSPLVRAQVRGAYRHVLVDEVQDVSESQWELVRWIASADGEGRVLRPACLFAVGDEKQSIYRFRGAEVQVFARLREAVRASNADVCADPRVPDGEGELPKARDGLVTLADNFRSHEAPLAFTNELFARLFGDAREPWEARPQALYARRDGRVEGGMPAPGVDLVLHVDSDEVPEEADGEFLLLYAEADRVARYLVRENVSWRHCAILLPQRTHLRSYEDALRRHGVPFVVLGGVGFWQAQEVVDAICLLEVLADERRDIELASVLRSPLFALPDALLYVVARQRKGSLLRKLKTALGGQANELVRAASEDERAQLARALEQLDRWRRLAGRIGAAELLARALDESGAWAGYAQGLRGPQRLANLAKLLDLVREYEGGGFRSLGDTAAALRVLLDEEEREGEAAVEAAGIDAVRILTIHAAKGLEFPLVIVPEMGARFRGSQERALLEELGGRPEIALKVRDDRGELAKTGLWSLLSHAERKKGDAEMKRLLYVACTRARERLVLSGAVRSEKIPARTWLGWLCEHTGLDLAALPATARKLGEARYRVVREEDLPRPKTARAEADRPPLGEEAARAALAAAKPVEEIGARVRLTPTVAKDLERCAHKVRLRVLTGVPEETRLARVDLDEPLELEEAAPGALERGTLLHRAFELEAWAAPDPESIVRRLASTARLADPALVQQVVAQVRAFGRSELGQRVARARPAWAEVPFVLFAGEVELAGQIDRLVREGSRWLVVDWKTDEVDAAAAAKRARDAGYVTQMQLYQAAARALVGADEVDAVVYFTHPGVAVEVPAGPSLLDQVAVRPLVAGEVPAPDAAVCRTCGYHLRRICPADRARIG